MEHTRDGETDSGRSRLTMTDDDLTQAELFDVFSNARRRRSVRYLRKVGGRTDLAPLVEHVAARENDVDPDAVTRTQRRRVYISLYQTHLPMLDDHGIVEWDPEEHTIELVPDGSAFDPYLDREDGPDRPWHRVYASLAAAGGLLLGSLWLPVVPLSTDLAPLVALVLSGAVLFVAIVQRTSRTGRLSRSRPEPGAFRD